FNEMLVDNDDEPNAGAVYVFVRNSGVWTQQAYLKAINAEAGDLFGWSVGIAGDTVMIGAVGESGTKSSDGKLSSDKDDDGATGAGAVYVFSRKGTEWKQIEYLKAENAGELDRFGYDVDIEANTLVVSAVGEKGDANSKVGAYNDNEGKDTGAVYVFTLAEGVWDQTHYLKAKDAKTKDAFGQSVAINDDTLVVGAPGKDGRKGAAYIFNRDDSNWLYSVTLSASNAEAGDLFGYSVDIDGNSLVISAVSEGGDVNSTIEASNNDAPESGAAYLYVRSGDVWEQQVYVKASNPDDKDFFGFSVGISGDTLVVGANGEASADGVQSDNNAAGAGAVYVFQ
ncbi:MAG: FG-GAP repeat protein, partial [Gammaproteobacteria bacterium]|nr:FG-GAP repeat protein [Gammaproteobacteria bacterium]